MAARRASMQLVKVLQVQTAVGNSVRPLTIVSAQSTIPSRVVDFATSSHQKVGNRGFDRIANGRSFAQELHSQNQVINDNHETHAYENSKMVDEGGGSVDTTYHEAAAQVKEKKAMASDDVKDKAKEAEEKAENVKDSVKDQASKEADTAKDMFKDFPQKVSETATGIKEVGVEAGKAIKRDAGKVAEKVGVKSE